jgi:N-acetylneuraminic acid mutarotase
MRVGLEVPFVLLVAGLSAFGCTPPDGNFPDPPISRPSACSVDAPNGECADGETCRDGQCIDDALLCSAELPDGLCASSAEQCVDGDCHPLSALCSEDNLEGLCAQPLGCTNGQCATDAPCAPEEPLGFCDLGFGCLDGGCVASSQLCSPENTSGLCATGDGCLDGSCTDESLLCSAANTSGLCPTGAACLDGSCAFEDELCSVGNPLGRCPAGESCNDGVCGAPDCGCDDNETCLDGFCRDDDLLCGPSNPVGLCASGFDCLNGECVDAGASCSSSNPTGVCPAGQVCESGECIALDGAVLCNDDNPCTQDFFDPDRNRCGHTPQAASCSDGNACTTDVCGAGVCEATPIGGCLEPPSLDPVVSPTNLGELILTGDKPAGAAVVINDLTAVPENPETTWTVSVNLTPGENTYVIFTDDGGTQSETIEVKVVYDITPPGLNITPAGGQFLNGVTVTVAADEPARVYYTTDGSDPDLASPSFQSLKQLRVFDQTELRFLVQDQAGNLSDEIFTADFEVTSSDNGWSFATNLDPEALIFTGAAFDYTEDLLYVVGGSDGNAPQAGAYVLTPETGDWTTLPSMVDARAQLSLIADDGRIIAMGGEKEGTPLNRVEVLEPGAQSWAQRTPMPSTRFSAVAAQVGREIFVLGGEANGGTVVPNLEVYDPDNDTWDNQRAQMPRARKAFGAIPHGSLIYVVGGVDGAGDPVAEVDIYDVNADTWTEGAPLPNPRGFAAVFKHENRGAVKGNYVGVVIAGGRDGAGNGTVLVDEYILDEDRWISRTPLDQPRHSGAGHEVIVPGAADVDDGQGWIIGGQLPSGVTNTIVAFDAPQDFVRRLPDLPEPRFMHAAVAHDDRIYLLGGRDFSETKSVLVFDPETETYEAGTDLPTFQSGLVAVSVAGRIYAIGGADNFGNAVATVHAYDPASRIWQLRRPMPTSRRDAAVATFGEQVWVIGGENNGALQTVEVYDPETDTWAASTTLPFPLKGAHATVYNDQVYVLGGEKADGTLHSGVLRYTGTQWVEDFLDGNGFETDEGVVAFGKMVRTGPDTVAILAGRGSQSLRENIWTINLSTQFVSAPYGQGSNLIDAVDFAASAFLNGSVYLFGGNAEEPVGSTGSTRAFKVDARCLDGVQNGREEPTGGFEDFDHGGGCGLKAIGHSVTVGAQDEIFFNTQSGVFNQQTAISACNAITGESCGRVGSSCSVSVNTGGSCSFNGGDFLVFQYCATIFFNSSQNVAGNVYQGCTADVVGSFD